LVNVRGCNGSGKSTIPLCITGDPDKYVVEQEYEGRLQKIATVFPSRGWVILGSYHNKCGGLDGFKNTETIKFALGYVLKNFPEHNVLMEGAIVSTVRSTYIEMFRAVETAYPDIKCVVLNLVPPFEVCLERIYERNGGREIKEEQVKNKYNTVLRIASAFREAGFTTIKLNNANIPKEKMWDAFIWVLERGEDYV